MRNKVFLRIVAKIRASGQEPDVTRVRDGMTEVEAFDLEATLIAQYGRIKVGGVLCNLTDGGEGVSGHAHDGETRKRMTELRRMRGPQVGDYKGVSSMMKCGMWEASIEVGGKNACLGFFRAPEDAAKAYDAAAYEAWGSDCFMNFPDSIGCATPQGSLSRGRTKDEAMRLRGPLTGEYKGIYFDKRRGKWQARIRANGGSRYPGLFPTPEEAARAYDTAAIEAWGFGNCYLNFPDVYAKSS
ncbi:AP2 domain-containing protein [Rhizobium leguminosarum]|uniref:AP2 domain-containing protein n=1 Tax=Rhizobium leguminosarum TaxID=384 RepID=UPI0015DAAFA2|nr:AP2 domain-containing protein [Rhizobium leguminosarum]NZD50526.1 hypothetical protein [Rhizobium leguminosarum]